MSNSIQTRSGSRYTRSEYTTETTENTGNGSFVELHNSSEIDIAGEEFETTVLIPTNSDPQTGDLRTPLKSETDKFIEEARLQSTKPYRVKDVCPKCSSPVTEDQHGLECESCFIWHHCACQDISDDEYIQMQNNHDDRWICLQCQQKEASYHTDIHWGPYRGNEEIGQKLDSLYKEISAWQKNNFLLPRGKSGCDFIAELTRLLNLFNQKTHLEQHAISLAIIFISVMTQKPSRNSKAKENSKYLKERLLRWHNQEIDCLMKEMREIQKRLVKHNKRAQETKEKSFIRLVLQGKISQAMRFIDHDSTTTGVHQISECVLSKLKDKHPPASEANCKVQMEITKDPPV